MVSANKIVLGAVVLVAVAASGISHADDKRLHREAGDERALDQYEALERRSRREFRPLSEVIATALKVIPGDVVRIKLKGKAGRPVYELKIVNAHGRIREVYIDPATLDVLKIE